MILIQGKVLRGCFRENAVVEPGGGSIDAVVFSVRWQEDEESMRGVELVIHLPCRCSICGQMCKGGGRGTTVIFSAGFIVCCE